MSLPPRGTGLATGRAGERRYGQPRTEAERQIRHSEGNPTRKDKQEVRQPR